jgi:respiratory burst oxidase
MIRSEGLRGAYSEDSSDTESTASDRTAFSGPLASGGGGLINKSILPRRSRGSIFLLKPP